ncbi:MAG: hypothetical protein HY908_14770 [Myxococcales bacterium]|nr:hypothetical protein [Myxococcales bacterium]
MTKAPLVLCAALVACGTEFSTGGSGGTGGATSTTSTTTSSTTSTTASGGAGGQGGDATGGAGGAGLENCLDGVDNNGDSHVDCADPQCSAVGFACRPEPGPGWVGPIVLQDAALDCPARWPAAVMSGGASVTFAATVCGCTCGGAVDVTCDTVQNVGRYADAACNTASMLNQFPIGACTNLQNGASFGAIEVMPVPCSGGTCPPVPGVNKPPATWVEPSEACAPGGTPGGCDDGRCAPPGGASLVCVAKQGAQQACPAGYPTGRTIFTAMNDTRGCTACNCGPAAPGTCDTMLHFYANGTCAAPAGAVLPDDGVCTPMDPQEIFLSARPVLLGTNSATCEPSDPTPTGTVTAATPYTVCCM